MKSSVLLVLLLSPLLCEVNTRPVLEEDSNTHGDEDLEDSQRLMYKADPNIIYPEVKDDLIDLNWSQRVQYRRRVSGQKSSEPVNATSTARNSGRSPRQENRALDRALDRAIINPDVPELVPNRGPVSFVRSSEPESSSKMEGKEGLQVNVDEGVRYDGRGMVQEDQFPFPLSSNRDNSTSAEYILPTPSAAYKPAQFPSASTIRGPVTNQ